jgi:hypothetical protein
VKIFAPGILYRAHTARRDDTWLVIASRLANGRVQWVDLLSSSPAMRRRPALCSPHTKVTYRKSLLLPFTTLSSSHRPHHHSLSLQSGAPPLTPTHRLSLLPRAFQADISGSSWLTYLPTTATPRSQLGLNTTLAPQDAFASACRRHVCRGPRLSLQPAFRCF